MGIGSLSREKGGWVVTLTTDPHLPFKDEAQAALFKDPVRTAQ